MSVQISSLQVKELAKNLRKAMTYGYVSEIIQEVVTDPVLVKKLNSAIGKKKDKSIRVSSSNNLISAACGFDNFESTLNSASTKKHSKIESDKDLLTKLNSLTPPKNKVVFMEKNLSLLMSTFPCLSEQQAIQLLLSDHFLFFDEKKIYFSTSSYGKSASRDRNLPSGLISAYNSISENRLIACLSDHIFRGESEWKEIKFSKSLPENSEHIYDTIPVICGFLSCAADIDMIETSGKLNWLRCSEDYESVFEKLRYKLKNNPLISRYYKDSKYNDYSVYTRLREAVEAVESTYDFLYRLTDDQFLDLASFELAESTDDEIEIYRTIEMSEDEIKTLEEQGSIPSNDDLEDDAVYDTHFWEISYLIKITDDCNFELSISKDLKPYFHHARLEKYNGWITGGAFPPRVAKIIWDDLNNLFPRIEGSMSIINKDEFIKKMALLTYNRNINS